MKSSSATSDDSSSSSSSRFDSFREVGLVLDQVVGRISRLFPKDANGRQIELPFLDPLALTSPLKPCHRPHRLASQKGMIFTGSACANGSGKYGACLYPIEEERIERAKTYAKDQCVKYLLHKQQQQQQRHQLDFIKKQQALLLMCRLYVGSIYYEVREDNVKQAFSPFGPIRSVSMTYDTITGRHKGFAFVEYDLPDAAQLALEQMNNAVLGGRNIKVGRPSNTPQAQPVIEQLTEEAKKSARMFVSNIHPEISENDVKCVFEAFGKVKYCVLAKNPTASVSSKHKGYGFVEYENMDNAVDAIATMNLFDLGGQLLRVGRAITPPDGLLLSTAGVKISPARSSSLIQPAVKSHLPHECAMAAAQITAQLQAIDIVECPVGNIGRMSAKKLLDEAGISSSSLIVDDQQQQQQQSDQSMNSSANKSPTPPPSPPKLPTESQTLTEGQLKILGMTADDSIRPLGEEPSIRGKEQRQLVTRKLMESRSSSSVVLLTNMVDPDGVDDDLESDIKEECMKYGEVKQVVISEQPDESDRTQSHIRIFVEFTSSDVVENAISALDGRYFGGRVVKARTYDQNLFNNGYYAAS